MTKVFMIECFGYRSIVLPAGAQDFIEKLRSYGLAGKEVRIYVGVGGKGYGTFGDAPKRVEILSAL